MKNKKYEAMERRRRQKLSHSKRNNPQMWIDQLEDLHKGDRICRDCGHLITFFDGDWCYRCDLE